VALPSLYKHVAGLPALRTGLATRALGELAERIGQATMGRSRDSAVVDAVLAGYGLRGVHAIDATRTLRAALHGFVTLEAAGGFALAADVGTSFDRMVVALASTLERWVVSPSVDPSGPAPSRDPAGTGYPGRGSTPPLDPRR
ncbi:MAG: TetR-like C-terminal domain-containing protein, partial [Actinomycetes bacterium]